MTFEKLCTMIPLAPTFSCEGAYRDFIKADRLWRLWKDAEKRRG